MDDLEEINETLYLTRLELDISNCQHIEDTNHDNTEEKLHQIYCYLSNKNADREDNIANNGMYW